MLKTGDIIDSRYRISQEIGQGGMGTVYSAFDMTTKKYVAIKEVKKVNNESNIKEKAAFESFKQEVEIHQTLNNPYIPRITHVFESEENVYIVMDLIEGQTLNELIRESKEPFSQNLVLDIGVQLCEVLHYLHKLEKPMIYCDLKPANIILQEDTGMIRLLDFGAVHDPVREPFNIKEALRRGENIKPVFNSKGYSPKELISDTEMICDERVDIYSLGKTLRYLLTKQHGAKEIPNDVSYTTYNDGITSGFEAVIRQLCAEDRELRPKDMLEARYLLQNSVDFDDKEMVRVKRKILFRNITKGLLALTLGGSILSGILYKTTFDAQYKQIVTVARQTKDMNKYYQAIGLDKGNTQLYKEGLEILSLDTNLKNLNKTLPVLISTISENKKELLKNMDGYGNLSYDLGKVLWYFSRDNLNIENKVKAISWFEDAKQYSNNQNVVKLSEQYINLGMFYKDIKKKATTGDDVGDYKTFFTTMVEQSSDMEKQTDVVVLAYIEQYISYLNIYLPNLLKDGVTLKELQESTKQIETLYKGLTNKIPSLEAKNKSIGKNLKDLIARLSKQEKKVGVK